MRNHVSPELGLVALLLGLSGPQSDRHRRDMYSLICHDASANCIGLLGKNSVSQSLQSSAPFGENLPRHRGDVYGIVQPFGTPIIHSIKDGAGICVPDGFAALPDNPYSKPSKYAERLVDFSHDSLERR